MYPGTIIEFEDRSQINRLPIQEVRHRPLFGTVFTSDKGTEGWYKVKGSDFFKMYGSSISFARHGQPLLQTAMAINAGGEMLCKRLVADDATLANIGIVATIEKSETQKVDAENNKVYLDADGNETTQVTDTPCMISEAEVKFSIKTAQNVKTLDEAYSAIKSDCTDDEYLLYVITDIGRGTSKKRIKLIPNYRLSKGQIYTLYMLYVMENSEDVETMTFTTNPAIIISNQNISLMNMIKNNSTQLKCYEDEAALEKYVSTLAEAAGLDYETMYKYDILNCRTNKGEDIPGIHVSNDGIDLQYAYGQMLTSGSNGSFGDVPINNKEEWSKQAIYAISGKFDNCIFNLDQYRLTCWIDANYPPDVKRQIEYLAAFREDFMYFRDQGTEMTDLIAIENETWNESHNMFCASYCQSYDILDPYTKKQITVTIGYSLARLMVGHCDNGCIRPPAGIKYDMVIPEAIYGTVSFIPVICPDPEGNQKEAMEDMRVNYASYIDNQLVIESLWTSQEEYSQWSFINNVMGIQEVVKAIRIKCPAIRYSFIEGEDLEKYRADVEEVIAPFLPMYDTLQLEYVQDATYAANKIFYAVLKVVYKNFVQTEWFKIIALNSVEVVNA